jgi:hypothetical protein
LPLKKKLDESDDSEIKTSSERATYGTSAPKKKVVKRGAEGKRSEVMQVYKEYTNEQKEGREEMGLMRELIDVLKKSTKK